MFDLKKALIPMPQCIEDKKKEIKIGVVSRAEFSVLFDNNKSDVYNEAKKLLENKITEKTAILSTEATGDYKIILKVESKDVKFASIDKKEAYYIDIDENQTVLCGIDDAGAYYAVVTFLSLIHFEGDSILLPKSYILDYPSFSQRGQFMECRYGSDFMTIEDWKKAVDYLSMMKFNHLTIGLYGCWTIQYDNMISEYQYIPFKKYPELNTPRNVKYYSVKDRKWVYKKDVLPVIYETDFFGDLIAYAKKKNIKVIPLFNSLGHNSLLPTKIPEISAKDINGNPTPYGFCTRNEKTYEVLFNIYDEIIDRYLVPNGIDEFEIGLDEVDDKYICHCEKCKNVEHSELMIEHIIKLCQYLKKRGMKKVFIYHDMLYHKFNMVNEDLKKKLIDADIYDVVVLDWWSYDDPVHLFSDNQDGVNNIFKSIIKPDTGYYHWAMPTENNENIRACAKLADKLSFDGIESYSSFEYCYDKNYLTLADVSWNKNNIDSYDEFELRYAMRYYDDIPKALKAFKAMHEIMIDETRAYYINRLLFTFEYYLHGYFHDKKYPRNFPGDVYKLLLDNPEDQKYVEYLEGIRAKAKEAYNFFNNANPSKINDVWKLTAKQYYVLCDEYLTILYSYKTYIENLSNEFDLVNELKRLILQREALMLDAENLRCEANSYMYLRNMSIMRQYLVDLLNYVQKEIKAGSKPKFEIENLEYTASELYYFLR